MAAAYTNGHDRRIANEPEPDPVNVKPCAARLGHGSWCFLPDGHPGDHAGMPAQYGPVEELPPHWRDRRRGRIK